MTYRAARQLVTCFYCW